MADPARDRIAFLDWVRGFACIGMFETHGYDAWLNDSARHSALFRWSQLGGTLPAPLFLFASGISLALVLGRASQKGIAPREASRKVMLRGAEIFAFGMLFRVQEYVLGQPYAPRTDLLRVDILNVIGIAIVLMALMCGLVSPRWAQEQDSRGGNEPSGDQRDFREAASVRRPPVQLPPAPVRVALGDRVPRSRYVLWATALAAAIAALTPPLWTTHRPRWLPWYLESYINGVHNLGAPQPWLFPIFPWVAFAFAGLAFGFLIFSRWARAHETPAFAIAGCAGAILAVAGWWLDGRRTQVYAVYDFWHTSPNFFLIRTGVVLGIVFLAYAWCRWGAALKGFSPVNEMGRTSLFVYWLHLEFVYGRFSILRKGGQSILGATAGILAICVAMTMVAAIRNRTKGRGLHALAFWRKPVRAPA